MTFQIDTSKGWTETITDSNCEFSKFERIVSLLKTKLNVVFTEVINDFDTCYLDFIYKNSHLCLHYNVYLGISIFPKTLKHATQIDNENVVTITNILMSLLEDART